MKPLSPGRNVGCIGRQAEFKRLKPAAKLGILGSVAKLKRKTAVAGHRDMNLVRGNRCFSAVVRKHAERDAMKLMTLA